MNATRARHRRLPDSGPRFGLRPSAGLGTGLSKPRATVGVAFGREPDDGCVIGLKPVRARMMTAWPMA